MSEYLHRIIDAITNFCGTVWFLLCNAVAFAVWILINTVLPRTFHYDLYPFNFLTLSVSLEAIFLSIFVLISQNRQAASDRARNEQEFALNVKEEQQGEDIIARLERIEQMVAKK